MDSPTPKILFGNVSDLTKVSKNPNEQLAVARLIESLLEYQI
jgi:hypothetical protein